MNRNDELYFKRLKLYMEARKYEVNTTILYENIIKSLSLEELKKIILDNNSAINRAIEELESIIRKMQPDKYVSDEVMEPLLLTKGILDSYKLLKRDLKDYVINYNCSDIL